MADFNYPGDLWTLELELLGFEQAGEELVSMAAYGDPPFAVGVFGKWGSGKTSILRYCMARLGGELIITSTTSDLTALIPCLSDLEAFIKCPPEEIRPFLLKTDEVWPMSPENEEYLRKYYTNAMKHPLSPLSSAKRLLEGMKEKGIEKVDIGPEAFAKWLEGELDKIEGHT